MFDAIGKDDGAPSADDTSDEVGCWGVRQAIGGQSGEGVGCCRWAKDGVELNEAAGAGAAETAGADADGVTRTDDDEDEGREGDAVGREGRGVEQPGEAGAAQGDGDGVARTDGDEDESREEDAMEREGSGVEQPGEAGARRDG